MVTLPGQNGGVQIHQLLLLPVLHCLPQGEGFPLNMCARGENWRFDFFKDAHQIPIHSFTEFYFYLLVHLLHHLWIQLYLFEWLSKHNLFMHLNARVRGTAWIAGHIPISRSIAGCLACQWPVSMTIVWCLRMSHRPPGNSFPSFFQQKLLLSPNSPQQHTKIMAQVIYAHGAESFIVVFWLPFWLVELVSPACLRSQWLRVSAGSLHDHEVHLLESCCL